MKERLARLRIYAQMLVGILAISGSANGRAQTAAPDDETTSAPQGTCSLRLVIDDALLSALRGIVVRENVIAGAELKNVEQSPRRMVLYEVWPHL